MRALELLNYLGALDDNGNMTEVGAAPVLAPICFHSVGLLQQVRSLPMPSQASGLLGTLQGCGDWHEAG